MSKRNIVWRKIMSKWYNLVSHLDKNAEVKFMNFGYSCESLKVKLKSGHEANRYPIQLYHQVASKADLDGKDILEVGCGRGGGLDYVVESFTPKSAAGVDLSPRAISFCKNHYEHTEIDFRVANAESLPFEDNSLDVILNVESSHIYGDMHKFLSEAKRVLRKGGYLLITDFRRKHRVDGLMKDFKRSGLLHRYEENITAKVIGALEKDDARRRELVKKLVPNWLHKYAFRFAAVKDSRQFNDFVGGSLIYYNFVYQKEH